LLCIVLPEGGLRALLQLRSLHPPAREGGDQDVTSQSQQYQALSREEQVLRRIEKARSRKAKLKEERIVLAHGSGGKATQTLMDAVFLEAFATPLLAPLEDGAVLPALGGRLAFTTDSYVVSPLFFPRGGLAAL